MSSNETQTPGPAALRSSDGLGAGAGVRYLASGHRAHGPRFHPTTDGRDIFDEDFIFDAMLRVRGDFLPDDRAAYVKWICDTLNEADKTLPRVPRGA